MVITKDRTFRLPILTKINRLSRLAYFTLIACNMFAKIKYLPCFRFYLIIFFSKITFFYKLYIKQSIAFNKNLKIFLGRFYLKIKN